MDLLSPWANITHKARAQTLRKYKVLHQYFQEWSQPFLFDRTITPEDEEYVLLGLTMKECIQDLELPNELVATRRWAGLPGSLNPVPELDIEAPGLKWIAWAQDHNRRMRAAVLEWVLMDLTGGPEFLQRGCNDVEFRKIFLSHYTPIESVLSRLGAAEITTTVFFVDRIELVRKALETEEKLLDYACHELAAREERAAYYRGILTRVSDGDMDAVIGYDTHVPPLPQRPIMHRMR